MSRRGDFYSFGGREAGGQRYDRQTLENMLRPQTLLAWGAIEFAADYRHTFNGEGGYQEDHDFFDTMTDN